MSRKSSLAIATLLAMVFACRLAECQQPPRPYDGIQAGFDAYQFGEEKRQANVGQQLYLNDLSRARLTPLATYGYGNRPFASSFGPNSLRPFAGSMPRVMACRAWWWMSTANIWFCSPWQPG